MSPGIISTKNRHQQIKNEQIMKKLLSVLFLAAILGQPTMADDTFSNVSDNKKERIDGFPKKYLMNQDLDGVYIYRVAPNAKNAHPGHSLACNGYCLTLYNKNPYSVYVTYRYWNWDDYDKSKLKEITNSIKLTPGQKDDGNPCFPQNGAFEILEVEKIASY